MPKLDRRDLRYTYRDAFDGAKFPAPKWASSTYLDSQPYESRRFPVFGHGSIGTSDYGGAADIGRSNTRVIRDQFSDLDGRAFVFVRGNFGYADLMFRARLMRAACEAAQRGPYKWEHSTIYQRLIRFAGEETADQVLALAEILNGLDKYAVIDESDLSDLNMSEADEAWADWGAGDFLKEACEALSLDFPGFKVAGKKAKKLWALYEAHGGLENESPYCEGGDSYVFPKLTETAGKVSRDELIKVFGAEVFS